MSDTTQVPDVDPGLRYASLSPTQRAVYAILYGRPDGACRQTFAFNDIYEVANRISEIETRLNITIKRANCKVHQHRHRVVRYSL